MRMRHMVAKKMHNSADSFDDIAMVIVDIIFGTIFKVVDFFKKGDN